MHGMGGVAACIIGPASAAWAHHDHDACHAWMLANKIRDAPDKIRACDHHQRAVTRPLLVPRKGYRTEV
jgi:hypothetical protein